MTGKDRRCSKSQGINRIRQKTGFSVRQIEGYGPQTSQIGPFLLATVATPIDSAHQCICIPFCSCAQLSGQAYDW